MERWRELKQFGFFLVSCSGQHLRLLKLLKSKPYVTKSIAIEEGLYEFDYPLAYLRSMGIKIKNKKINKEERYILVR